METIHYWIDLILHADKFLPKLILDYQGWIYVILFAIIFCETGLVFTPFLPGDSLLFAAGTIASSQGSLNIYTLLLLIFIAAFSGDNSNYFIGRYFGPKIFNLNLRFIHKDYLVKTHSFYEKYGGRVLVIARFMPIIRTFAPFVAGVSKMTVIKFQIFNIIGAVLWVAGLLMFGYLFGNMPLVRDHLNTLVLFGFALAILPIVLGAIWQFYRRFLCQRK